MIIYLSGVNTHHYAVDYYYNLGYRPSFLESFFYLRGKKDCQLIKKSGKFILDSGAFTFGQFGKGKKADKINWDSYVEEYANFINANSVEHFFELDIDSVIGYERVLQLRTKLEKLVGRPSIPVWHKNRGLEEFKKMCSSYPYVAIGGIVAKEVLQKEHEYFSYFIREAHSRGAKIHGLGFTNVSRLPDFHFDSVDSISWLAPSMYGGQLKYFTNGTLKNLRLPKNLNHNKDTHKLIIFCLGEWIKYQQYAENHL